MTKPGPSPDYRDLLEGRITPEEYVERLKREAQERLEREGEKRHEPVRSRRARAAA
jgi:hypothetical protein